MRKIYWKMKCVRIIFQPRVNMFFFIIFLVDFLEITYPVYPL